MTSIENLRFCNMMNPFPWGNHVIISDTSGLDNTSINCVYIKKLRRIREGMRLLDVDTNTQEITRENQNNK